MEDESRESGRDAGADGAAVDVNALPEPPIEALAERITSLEDAFRGYAAGAVDLAVEVVGHVSGSDALVHPAAGFTVRMERAGGGVSLYITAGYGELTRWRGPGLTAAGALRERFRVDLLDAYSWGDTVFPSAEELVHALVGYMHYNLDTLG
jgi:hypothetical protein